MELPDCHERALCKLKFAVWFFMTRERKGATVASRNEYLRGRQMETVAVCMRKSRKREGKRRMELLLRGHCECIGAASFFMRDSSGKSEGKRAI